MTETTKEQFEFFKAECLKWQELFFLQDWELNFQHKDVPGMWALTKMSLEGRNTMISFSTHIPDGNIVDDAGISRTAKHEMLHILLAPLGELAQYRYVQPRELEAAEHNIVQKLLLLIP